jgi:preprotein translocase subunit SecG
MLLFAIVIILFSIVLGLIVLVQNPKGGGLSGTFGGVGTQLMGVKQTTDVLEKGTWVFAGLVAILCLISPLFIKVDGGASKGSELIEKSSSTAPAATPTTPAGTTPLQTTPAATDSTKK